jgi:glycosyltransferase involved in cell wall biosynthesis
MAGNKIDIVKKHLQAIIGKAKGKNCTMTRTRRIAIVCQPWDNVASQSDNSIVVIAYQLARCLSPDWHVTMYGRRGPGQKSWEIDNESIEFKRFKVFYRPHLIIERLLSVIACYRKRRINYLLSILYHPFYALRVALSIRASKCDVVLVHTFLQFASVIKLFNPSVTICLSMHCEWLSQFAAAAIERRLRAIDLIIGCSDYITERIKTRFPIIAARCYTVHDGVDTDRFCPAPDVPVPNAEPARLLYVGRVTPEKGIHVLIEAFKILAESRPTLQLDLVGTVHTQRYLYLAPDPDDRATASLEKFYGERLSEMVRRQLVLGEQSYALDLAVETAGDERIVFHGSVPQTETIRFYRHATVLVFPSVWNEPSGLPTFESQACGLPVVSTYSGGIPEYVEDGRTGILVRRGDAKELAAAISRVIDDPATARAMGKAGRQRVLERFTWELSARRLADLIESASGAPGSKRDLPGAAPTGLAAQPRTL